MICTPLRRNEALLRIVNDCMLSLGPPSHPESKGPGEVAALPGGVPRLCFPGKAVAVIKGGKSIVTERRFPHIVEIAIPERGLDPQTSRSILDFHRSRKIRVRFGRSTKNVCRWCFSNTVTAEDFKEQFGGRYKRRSAKSLSSERSQT